MEDWADDDRESIVSLGLVVWIWSKGMIKVFWEKEE